MGTRAGLSILIVATGVCAAAAARTASPAPSIPPAARDYRGYDSAISCKAISLLAKNAGDKDSKAALKRIDAVIDKEIAKGKTRAQADTDIEFERSQWKSTIGDVTLFDAEWTSCLARFG